MTPPAQVQSAAASLNAASLNPAPQGLADSAVASAYRVYDQYIEEGRQYAAGQSAWFNRQNRPTAGTAGGGALTTWLDLAAKVLPAILADFARRPSAPLSLSAFNANPPQQAWRPWFNPAEPTSPQRQANSIPWAELQRRRTRPGPF